MRACTAILPLLALAGCGGTEVPFLPPPSPPSALTIVAGDGQAAKVGDYLGQPLTVRVTDARNTGLAGVPVHWTVSAGRGDFGAAAGHRITQRPVITLTESDGVARVWFRPTLHGPLQVAASTDERLMPAVFTVATTGGHFLLIRFSPLMDCTVNDTSMFTFDTEPMVPGTQVEWEYMDWVHPSCSARIRSRRVPAGGPVVDSDILKPGQRYTVSLHLVGDW